VCIKRLGEDLTTSAHDIMEKVQKGEYFSKLGEKSGEARALKAGEKLLTKSFIERISPEISMLIDTFAPEAKKWIEEHPDLALQLFTKYAPLFGLKLSSFGGERLKKDESVDISTA